MKGLINYTPTDEDISEVLKEFTVDFLLKGYGRLVENLYSQFLTDINLPIDISHLFWLITYFLKFAVQLELDLELISPVLSFNIISYLVFQGVWQLEELEICRRFVDLDLQPHLRRLHLVNFYFYIYLVYLFLYFRLLLLSENFYKLLKRINKILVKV